MSPGFYRDGVSESHPLASRSDARCFLSHPGGAKAILLYKGRDATEEFDMLHERGVIEKYAKDTIIGNVKQ